MATREDHTGLAIDEASSWIYQFTGDINSSTAAEVEVNTKALRLTRRAEDMRFTRVSMGTVLTSAAGIATTRIAQPLFLFVCNGTTAASIRRITVGICQAAESHTGAHLQSIQLFKGAGYLITDVPGGSDTFNRLTPDTNPIGLKTAQFVPCSSFWNGNVNVQTYTFGSRTLETNPLSSVTGSSANGLRTTIDNAVLWDVEWAGVPLTLFPCEGLEVLLTSNVASTSQQFNYATTFVWDEVDPGSLLVRT